MNLQPITEEHAMNMIHLDFSSRPRRPSAAQIVAAWKNTNCVREFSVSYGETYAVFERAARHGPARWHDSGNGCLGVNRAAVVKALEAATMEPGPQELIRHGLL